MFHDGFNPSIGSPDLTVFCLRNVLNVWSLDILKAVPVGTFIPPTPGISKHMATHLGITLPEAGINQSFVVALFQPALGLP